MKLVFLTTMKGVPWGGSEILWSEAAQRAVQIGDEVTVIVFDWSMSMPAVCRLGRDGARIVARPRSCSRTLWRRLLIRAGFERLVDSGEQHWIEQIEALEPDVICISQGNTYEAFSDAGVMRFLGDTDIPVVHICHLNSEFHVPDEGTRSHARRVFRKARKVLFVARGNMEAAERQLAMRFDNASIILNPVNLERWDDYPRFPPDVEGVLRIALVARLDLRYKGHDLLLKALSTPRWKSRSWTLGIYGEGKDADYLHSLIDLYGLSAHVQYQGHVDDVRSIWRENHLLVLPSRAEGTPLALVEAMLMGRPAVVTDVGGHAEWVTEGETGYIAEGFTVRSIAAAMERAWRDRGRLDRMGRNARTFALQHIDGDPGGSLVTLLHEASASRHDGRTEPTISGQ